MSNFANSIQAEWIKLKNAPIVWITFLAFGLAPLMGCVFMLIMQNPEALAKAGTLKLKIDAMGLRADWVAYGSILTQAIGVGGILVFGFVCSWIFGREYTDGVAKDLLALPVSRAQIIHSKFTVYVIWTIALSISNLLIAGVLGILTGLPIPDNLDWSAFLTHYACTALLTIIIGAPIAYFALRGKGYLAPLGFVALTLVLAQIIAATGFGNYFPWAIPGLYSGISPEYRANLNVWSYTILSLTALAGYIASVLFWMRADQH